MKFDPWTLEHALKFLRDLDPKLRAAGFTCALTGGVLLKGESAKDLDVVVFPLCVEATARNMLDQTNRRRQVRAALNEAGMRCVFPRKFIREQWEKAGSRDDKWVEGWAVGALIGPAVWRVDFFLLE